MGATSTRSRNSLPDLKWGTYFPATCTVSPDLGLRPTRGRPVVQRKAAEAANLDSAATAECVGHGAEDPLHRVFRVPRDKLGEALCETVDEFCSCHRAIISIETAALRAGKPVMKGRLTA